MTGEIKETTGKFSPWVLSTLVLGALVITLAIFLFKGGITGNVISDKDIGQLALDFAISNLNVPSDATLESVKIVSGVYQIVINVQGEKASLYFTKDGNWIQQGGDLYSITGNAVANNNQNSQTNTNQPVNIPIGNSPVLGNADAKLTIVEFSDFSCPYCGAASGQTKDMVTYMQSKDPSWQPAVPGIIKDYVNTGKAKFVYKYSMGHTGGNPATLVGFCLNDQGLFWKFHDKAFADQADVENIDKMKAIAQSLGADMTKLNSCLDSKKYDSKLDEDETLGQTIGIGGTPAIYANGIKVANGAESYTAVKQAIDAVLAQIA